MKRAAARFRHEVSANVSGVLAYVAGTPNHTPRVSYGQRIPGPEEKTVGGIVKLQQLSRVFPESAPRFNVLYLVSSRLPPASVARADWAKRKGARLVINQNGVAYPAWHGAGWEAVNAEMTALLARADHVLYQSEFCRASADRFAGPPRGAWEVLHNTVDTSRFTPGPKPDGRQLTLLLGGSQDQWYRLDAAVRTLGRLVQQGADAELLVAGRLRWINDPVAARWRADALVAELGLGDRVTFLGPYTQADAPDLFRRADIVLHTKYNDPCPSVVIEAMACGRPVVYSKSGGVPELVGDQAGVGLEAPLSWERDIPPDPDGLAAGVLRVRGDLAAFAQAARARAVERFDVARWVARHREVLDHLVA